VNLGATAIPAEDALPIADQRRRSYLYIVGCFLLAQRSTTKNIRRQYTLVKSKLSTIWGIMSTIWGVMIISGLKFHETGRLRALSRVLKREIDMPKTAAGPRGIGFHEVSVEATTGRPRGAEAAGYPTNGSPAWEALFCPGGR
jgi:hypothetical protein